jgi:hypothetical protein
VTYEWGRLTYWLAQGQNAVAMQVVAAALVALVTAWYTFLTHRIMKATARQASAALQPVLALSPLVRAPDETFSTLLVHNPSDRPIVFLDVHISCHPSGHRAIVQKRREWDDQILPPKEHFKLQLDFVKELVAINMPEDACGFYAEIVAADLSRQVAIRYSWAKGHFFCTTGLPFHTWLRHKLRPWGWWYHRMKGWFR